MIKYRFKLAFLVTLPVSLATIFSIYYFENVNYTLICLIFIFLFFELKFFSEYEPESERDNGTLSGILTSSTLGLIVILKSLFISHRQVYIFIGCFLLIIGILLRVLSHVSLGKFFSHSLRITKDHNLITIGLYKYIRHPAYLGSILILTGASFFINIVLAFVVALISIFIATIRIREEEKLLCETFKNEFISYKANSWKLIPFLL